MQHKILIVGGSGVIGTHLIAQLSGSMPTAEIYIGSRTGKEIVSTKAIRMNVEEPQTFVQLLDLKIELVVQCFNDKSDNLLNFCLQHHIKYLDITKPTPELVQSFTRIRNKRVGAAVVFASGWMAGAASNAAMYLMERMENVSEIDLFIYYSLNDKSGESSEDFLADYIPKRYIKVQSNSKRKMRQFTVKKQHHFHFDDRYRTTYNFDAPDGYTLHEKYGVPTVGVWATYNSSLVAKMLSVLQQLYFFNLLNRNQLKTIFAGKGTGDITSFDLVAHGHVKSGKKISSKISITSQAGQSYLTAFSTLQHIKAMLSDNAPKPGVYFSEEIHQAATYMKALENGKYLTVKYHG